VSLFQLRSLGLILSIPVTTSLLFVQQLFFLVLAVGFIQFLHRHNISLSIIKQFKRMLYIGVVFIFALLLQVLVSVVYLVAYSVQHYLIVIIVGRASFALVQFCILKLPNTADIGWTPREDVQVHATRPFTVQGHRTILNWLKTTFMEQEDSEDLGLVHMGDSSGTAELSIVHN
jgi:fatty acid desaturase